MRAYLRLLAFSLAGSLLSLPTAARADDALRAEPLRPVALTWPSDWSQAESAPAAPARAAQAAVTEVEEENEEFTFDEEEPAPAAVLRPPAPSAPLPPPTADESAAAPMTQQAPAAAAVGEVDLHAPHVWMATGAIVVGISVAAALALAVQFDKPQLAGEIVALGGLTGIAGLTVGVVMQNDRLAAAGQSAPKPSAMTLNLTFVR